MPKMGEIINIRQCLADREKAEREELERFEQAQGEARKVAINAFWEKEKGHGNFHDWNERKADNWAVWYARKEYEGKFRFDHASEHPEDPRCEFVSVRCDNVNLDEDMFCVQCGEQHATWTMKHGWKRKDAPGETKTQWNAGAMGYNPVASPVNRFPRLSPEGRNNGSDHSSDGTDVEDLIYDWSDEKAKPRHQTGAAERKRAKEIRAIEKRNEENRKNRELVTRIKAAAQT